MKLSLQMILEILTAHDIWRRINIAISWRDSNVIATPHGAQVMEMEMGVTIHRRDPGTPWSSLLRAEHTESRSRTSSPTPVMEGDLYRKQNHL